MSLREIWELLRATFAEWEFKQVSLLASSLAYYTVFSLAPLLIIVIAIVGAVFGEAAVKHEIVLQVQNFVGSKAAQVIETAIANTRQPDVNQGFFGLLLNLALVIYGSSKVFVHLQRSLNQIWEVKPEPERNFCYFIRKRFLSLAMVLVIAFLLLVSFTMNAILASAVNFLSGTVPGLGYLWQIFNFLISFSAIALLFTLIYKILPDARVAWWDAFIGAMLTALLFAIGQLLFALFLSQTDLGSAYGVAGSLVIIITWAYYSAHILLIGAEFTQVYARKRGSPIIPEEYAVRIPKAENRRLNSQPNQGSSSRKQKNSGGLLANLREHSIRIVQRLIRKWQRRR